MDVDSLIKYNDALENYYKLKQLYDRNYKKKLLMLKRNLIQLRLKEFQEEVLLKL